MPLEASNSVEVTQADPAYTFPVTPYVPYDERLFRHITFHETDPSLTLRIKAVNKGLGIESIVTQKHIQTQLPRSSSKEVFRIKAVLSQPEYGITESHWVTNKTADSHEATSHNQYRVRGVSKEKWIGDWVYSELRGFDNELIIYNMLHDIMDLMLTVNDGEIDKLMDYIASDTFVNLLKEKMPQISRAIDEEEFKAASIEEIFKLAISEVKTKQDELFVATLAENFKTLNSEMKKEFKESVMSSQEEFYALYRAYRIFDRFEQENEDFVRLLVETFLDDRYEKIVQKTNIEVLMQNDEEMGIYLNGQYDFRIKSELIEAAHHASLDDDFVTKINDAVQLISETDVFEAMIMDKTESVSQLVSLLLREVYAPLVAADAHLLELEKELEEAHRFDIKGSIVEYTTIQDELEVRNMLLRDVMETLLSEADVLEPLLNAGFVEKIISPITDRSKTILVDYKFDEVIKLLLQVGENFQYELGKLMSSPSEPKTVELTERVSEQSARPDHRITEMQPTVLTEAVSKQSARPVHSLRELKSVELSEGVQRTSATNNRSLKESYTTALLDLCDLSKLNSPRNLNESKDASILELMIEEFATFEKGIHEQVLSVIKEAASQTGDLQSYFDELLQATLSEAADVNGDTQSRINELLEANALEWWRTKETSQTRTYADDMQVAQNEHMSTGYLSQNQHKGENVSVGLADESDQQTIKRKSTADEEAIMHSRDLLATIFKSHLRDINWLKSFDYHESEIFPEIHDDYIFEGSDVVYYALGDMNSNGSLGVFRLGTTTLRGEV